MKEVNQLCYNFISILRNKDIQQYSGEAFWDFIKALFSGDVFAGISSINNIKDIIFHAPTVLFWRKMQRFLLGTYRDFQEQVKMSSRFSQDDDKYKEFVYQLMETIDKLDTEKKVDYYSNITRSFLLDLIDENLFYKFRQILLNCTLGELEFIKECHENKRINYDLTVFSLKSFGLVEQTSDYSSVYYILSDLAKNLKEHSLNGNDSTKHKLVFSEVTPPSDLVPMTEAKAEKIMDDIFGEQS